MSTVVFREKRRNLKPNDERTDYQDISRYFKMYQDVSRCFKIFRYLTMRAQMTWQREVRYVSFKFQNKCQRFFQDFSRFLKISQDCFKIFSRFLILEPKEVLVDPKWDM